MRKIAHINIVAIIQARMGSSRLPGKVLMRIKNKPILQHIIERVGHSKFIDKIVIATTDNQEDHVIVELCNNLKVEYFRGSESDVLDRYYQCAKAYGADIVVRITGDCPFADPDVIDKTIDHLIKSKKDYVSTAYPFSTFPDGLDVEVFNFTSLERAWLEAKLPSEREHVTPFIWKNENKQFKIQTIKNDEDLSNKRWTIDDEKDYQFIELVYNALYNECSIFKMQDILKFLQKNPQIEKINADTVRNEGYAKSLKLDKKVY